MEPPHVRKPPPKKKPKKTGARFIPLLFVTEEVFGCVLDACWTLIPSALWPPPQSQMSQNSSVVQSKTPGVVLEGLRPGTGYVVQVRARTVAGYGAYSKDMLFQTLTDGKCVVFFFLLILLWAGASGREEFLQWRGKRVQEFERLSKSENLAVK